jgi:hypothetical protein
MFSRHTHQVIHIICLLAAAFLMPVSVWLLSAVSIIMSANWLLGGQLKHKINILFSRRGIMVLLLLFAMYIIWLVNTADVGGALTELRLKLPLLFFPVVAGTTEKPGNSLLRLLIISFIAGCIFATGAGLMALAGILPAEIHSSRDLALFVPSIRLSILLCFAIFSALWLAITDRTDKPAGPDDTASSYEWAYRTGEITPGRDMTIRIPGGTLFVLIMTAAALTMSYFLFRLLSVTGIVLFILCLALTGVYVVAGGRRAAAGLSLLTAAAAATVAMLILGNAALRKLHAPSDPSVNEPLTLTASGNHYTQYPGEKLVENGYLVWVNVCEEELRQEWNRRSQADYDGIDGAGNELRVTLIRYITALGMPKDSAAVAELADGDIRNIERGFANPLYAHKGSPMARAYELAWELDRAAMGDNPSGLSLVQRPEFYRAAAGIIMKHPLAGVGTGDVARAFNDEYDSNATPLRPEYRLRAHNQYLTFGVTFGIPGAVVALAILLVPWLTSRNRFSYLFLLFMTVIVVSMFNDDTFGSFTGAAFFSYFYTLLIITRADNETQQ